jgi:hypothetical protein
MLRISETQVACLLECRQRIIDTAKCVLVAVDIKVVDGMEDELIIQS